MKFLEKVFINNQNTFKFCFNRNQIEEFQYIYNQLDINLIERGESFYQNLMDDVVAELDSKNLLVVEEGRKLIYVPGQQVPLTVVKSDGGYTYATSDLAAIKNRLITEKANIVFYVVDSGQVINFLKINVYTDY